jgi:hypothetical protein
MRVQSSTRYLTLAALAGALACAGNKARTDDGTQPDQAAAARDTTSASDTTQNPPGYRGMERDTSAVPNQQPTATDTFLQKQGQGTPQDTAGYSGMERVDTTGQAGRANPSGQDTSGYNSNQGTGQDTSGMSGMDSTSMQHGDSAGANGTSGAAGLDSTGMSRTGDTTGYQPSQQPQDSTTSR